MSKVHWLAASKAYVVSCCVDEQITCGRRNCTVSGFKQF